MGAVAREPPPFALQLVVAVALWGCGGGVGEKSYEKKQDPPLEQAKVILQRYADGQPMTSEVSNFPTIVEEVRKTDPAKADILQKGFDDLQKHKNEPSHLKEKSKELLKKL